MAERATKVLTQLTFSPFPDLGERIEHQKASERFAQVNVCTFFACTHQKQRRFAVPDAGEKFKSCRRQAKLESVCSYECKNLIDVQVQVHLLQEFRLSAFKVFVFKVAHLNHVYFSHFFLHFTKQQLLLTPRHGTSIAILC